MCRLKITSRCHAHVGYSLIVMAAKSAELPRAWYPLRVLCTASALLLSRWTLQPENTLILKGESADLRPGAIYLSSDEDEATPAIPSASAQQAAHHWSLAGS